MTEIHISNQDFFRTFFYQVERNEEKSGPHLKKSGSRRNFCLKIPFIKEFRLERKDRRAR